MTEKKNNPAVIFTRTNAEALEVYDRIQAIIQARKAENMMKAGREKVFAWQVIRDGLDALDTMSRITIIPYDKDTPMSELVSRVLKDAVNNIREQENQGE